MRTALLEQFYTEISIQEGLFSTSRASLYSFLTKLWIIAAYVYCAEVSTEKQSQYFIKMLKNTNDNYFQFSILYSYYRYNMD